MLCFHASNLKASLRICTPRCSSSGASTPAPRPRGPFLACNKFEASVLGGLPLLSCARFLPVSLALALPLALPLACSSHTLSFSPCLSLFLPLSLSFSLAPPQKKMASSGNLKCASCSRKPTDRSRACSELERTETRGNPVPRAPETAPPRAARGPWA